MGEAWIIDGVRSPRGKGKANGALHDIHPQELLAQVPQRAADRTGFDPDDVDDVIVGNGNSVGDHGACIGRMAVLAAGWPIDAPGVTLNRFCGSGQQAVTFAAMGVLSGHQDLVVGGGVESMSRLAADAGAARLRRPTTRRCASSTRWCPQGISADLIATVEGFTREECDELRRRQPGARPPRRHRRGPLRPQPRPDRRTPTAPSRSTTRSSPARARRSRASPSSQPSLRGRWAARSRGLRRAPFDDMCAAGLPERRPRSTTCTTPATRSGVVDGASALLVASPDYAQAHGLDAPGPHRHDARSPAPSR